VIWLWVVALVVVIGAAAVLAAGRDTSMAEAYDDRPDRTVPTGRPLTADDLAEVRFSTAVRGYRMDEVDAFIDRLRADLIAREHLDTESAESTGSAESAQAAESPPLQDRADAGERIRRHGHAGWNAGAEPSEAHKLGLDPAHDAAPPSEATDSTAGSDDTTSASP
jgi:DivIVA domain-containing protein